MADVSLERQIACVEREIKMRARVYPRWVEAKRITQANADAELVAMSAVLGTLKKLQMQVQPSLLPNG